MASSFNVTKKNIKGCFPQILFGPFLNTLTRDTWRWVSLLPTFPIVKHLDDQVGEFSCCFCLVVYLFSVNELHATWNMKYQEECMPHARWKKKSLCKKHQKLFFSDVRKCLFTYLFTICKQLILFSDLLFLASNNVCVIMWCSVGYKK